MATTYELTVQIDARGVEMLAQGGYEVTVVMIVASDPAERFGYVIPWQSVAPLMTIQISWDDRYFVYASPDPVEPRMRIVANSLTDGPVAPGDVATLNQDGSFTVAGETGGAYVALNESGGDELTFGLALGSPPAPLNAIAVLNGLSVAFVPAPAVAVYVSQQVATGTVTFLSDDALTVTMSPPARTVRYDDATGAFQLVV